MTRDLDEPKACAKSPGNADAPGSIASDEASTEGATTIPPASGR